MRMNLMYTMSIAQAPEQGGLGGLGGLYFQMSISNVNSW